jgi:hypothetical protein
MTENLAPVCDCVCPKVPEFSAVIWDCGGWKEEENGALLVRE